uniref:Uncharacterized protein n=1 Tax=Rhizophora mucronata TaxID=61149 RepID=A0A2P2QJL8_RHIMU
MAGCSNFNSSTRKKLGGSAVSAM